MNYKYPSSFILKYLPQINNYVLLEEINNFKNKYSINNIIWVEERVGPHFIQYKYKSLDRWSGLSKIRKETYPHIVIMTEQNSSSLPKIEYSNIYNFINNKIQNNEYIIDNSFKLLKVYVNDNSSNLIELNTNFMIKN